MISLACLHLLFVRQSLLFAATVNFVEADYRYNLINNFEVRLRLILCIHDDFSFILVD